MKDPTPYTCDYCWRRKGPSNHWFLRARLGYGFHLMPWDATMASKPDAYEHICSDTCAHTALSRWLNRSTVTKQVSVPSPEIKLQE